MVSHVILMWQFWRFEQQALSTDVFHRFGVSLITPCGVTTYGTSPQFFSAMLGQAPSVFLIGGSIALFKAVAAVRRRSPTSHSQRRHPNPRSSKIETDFWNR
jgi:hypothetical protein